MGVLGNDTHPTVEKILIDGYRAMTPAQKGARIAELNRVAYQLCTQRIRMEYGADISERELRLREASLRLPRDIMIQVFDWDPELHGY